MVAHINTLAFQGINVIPVDVQVHISSGLPAFSIVGLADKAIAESKERVRAALHSIGLALPAKRITINLAPADIAKEGSHYDVPIALGLLVAMEVLAEEELSHYIALGELSLDGSMSSVNGVLPAAIEASAKEWGVICPVANGSEAMWANSDLNVVAADSLLALINHFKGGQVLSPPSKARQVAELQYPDMADIRGQETAKRAIEIAAAGGHNILMNGPPGAGKSMLASRLPGLIPALDIEEILRVNMIASIAGLLTDGQLNGARPFRTPHHSCSMAAMVGGGRNAKPGEITLAHNGVLFLDELPEFSRNVLDSLRQPTETGEITVSRVNSHVTYPAQFQLVAAMNPCRCGYLSDPEQACNKVPRCAMDYQNKISGPLLDRMDIHIEVPAVNMFELDDEAPRENSQAVRERVADARQRQKERYAENNIKVNAHADGEVLLDAAKLDNDGKALLKTAVSKFNLSMRGYNRVLRVARTIADLEGAGNVKKNHLAEALTYRKARLRA